MRERQRESIWRGEEQRELELVLLENSFVRRQNFGDEINFSTRVIIDTHTRVE